MEKVHMIQQTEARKYVEVTNKLGHGSGRACSGARPVGFWHRRAGLEPMNDGSCRA